MPPGPAYNAFCVLYSLGEIIGHAARYRTSQLAPGINALTSRPLSPRKPAQESGPGFEGLEASADAREGRSATTLAETVNEFESQALPEARNDLQELGKTFSVIAEIEVNGQAFPPASLNTEELPVSGTTQNATILANSTTIFAPNNSDSSLLDIVNSEKLQPVDVPPQVTIEETAVFSPLPINRNLQSSKVPSSRIGRLFHYGGLAASLGYGAAGELIRRTGGASQDKSSVMMTEANIKRLVSKLSQMRGAALKLGQFMSIQDTHVLPPEIDKVFRRVQDSAHYMPDWQTEQVMIAALGADWASKFTSFDRLPFAAASIGQVHAAKLASSFSPTGKEEDVAVKIQFPNIANSIESDLGYIKFLLTAGSLLPKGLFLDKTIQVMKQELADECDYKREASFLRAFGSPEYLGSDPRYKVPWVWDGSTSSVLVMEHVQGSSVGDADVNQLTSTDRNDVAAWIIELCLKELFEFRAMQTDPNWSNFLWNAQTRQVELVDFGATRTYSKEFMDDWLHLLQAAALEDREACVDWSLKLGYLTGEENQIMLGAHANSMVLLATPFRASTPQPFSFGKSTQWADITAQIRAQIPIMLKHRLTPPPKETYSLNRKLSGAFLLASRLSATVDTREIWDRVVSKYKFGPEI